MLTGVVTNASQSEEVKTHMYVHKCCVKKGAAPLSKRLLTSERIKESCEEGSLAAKNILPRTNRGQQRNAGCRPGRTAELFQCVALAPPPRHVTTGRTRKIPPARPIKRSGRSAIRLGECWQVAVQKPAPGQSDELHRSFWEARSTGRLARKNTGGRRVQYGKEIRQRPTRGSK